MSAATQCLAWDNLLLGATLTADSYTSGMPPQNLQDDSGSPSVAWQTPAGTTSGYLEIAFGAPASVSVVGIFRANLTTSATVRVAWALGGSTVGALNMPTLVGGYGQMLIITPPKTADLVSLDIHDPTNPDGFLNIPLCFVGPNWLPVSGASYTSVDGNDDDVAELRTRGGQEFVTLHWASRRRNIVLSGVRDAELWDDLQPMLSTARRGGNMLYVPDTGSDRINQQAVFGRLKQTTDIGYLSGQYDRRTVTLSITERL